MTTNTQLYKLLRPDGTTPHGYATWDAERQWQKERLAAYLSGALDAAEQQGAPAP